MDDRPRLPGRWTRVVVDRLLAECNVWFEAGDLAWARYAERLLRTGGSWRQMVRLLELALAFGRLATGQDSPHYGLPEPDSEAQVEADLQRAYGSESAAAGEINGN